MISARLTRAQEVMTIDCLETLGALVDVWVSHGVNVIPVLGESGFADHEKISVAWNGSRLAMMILSARFTRKR